VLESVHTISETVKKIKVILANLKTHCKTKPVESQLKYSLALNDLLDAWPVSSHISFVHGDDGGV